ncbi:MAG: hypothetical protein SOV58_00190 [Candidatus Enteromonas sp.]|nr:hypothetical protein [Candidatus Enteromonas sp.]
MPSVGFGRLRDELPPGHREPIEHAVFEEFRKGPFDVPAALL